MVAQVLSDVGLDPEIAEPKRPHEFSGGQCQRISIARALVLEPKVVICDEPVSALDVSVQAQILNLLEDMKVRYGLTLIFIAHDLAVVKNVSDRVAVMYLGKLCEVASPDVLYSQPAHPYTAALLSAIPVPDPSAPAARPDEARRRASLAGDAPEWLSLSHPLPATPRIAARPKNRPCAPSPTATSSRATSRWSATWPRLANRARPPWVRLAPDTCYPLGRGIH